MIRGKMLRTDSWWRRYRGRTVIFTADATGAEVHPLTSAEVCQICGLSFREHFALGDGATPPRGLHHSRFVPPWPGLYCPSDGRTNNSCGSTS